MDLSEILNLNSKYLIFNGSILKFSFKCLQGAPELEEHPQFQDRCAQFGWWR